jgi:hypothetical protein
MIPVMENVHGETFGLERLANKGSGLDFIFHNENTHRFAARRIAKGHAIINSRAH